MVSLLRDGSNPAWSNAIESAGKAGGTPEPRLAADPSRREAATNGRACIALIDPRPLTRASMSQLLILGTPLQRRSEDLAIWPLASLEDFLAAPRTRTGNVAMIVFNLGAQCPCDSDTPLVTPRLRREYPDIPLVVLSDCEDPAHVMTLLREGIRGYIPTALEPAMVTQAMRLVLAGGIFIPPCMLNMVVPRPTLGGAVETRDVGILSVADTSLAGAPKLTRRQSQVFDLVRQGKSNKIIAHELGMQESTVKVHVRQIMRKMKALNRTHAAFLANQAVASP